MLEIKLTKLKFFIGNCLQIPTNVSLYCKMTTLSALMNVLKENAVHGNIIEPRAIESQGIRFKRFDEVISYFSFGVLKVWSRKYDRNTHFEITI